MPFCHPVSADVETAYTALLGWMRIGAQWTVKLQTVMKRQCHRGSFVTDRVIGSMVMVIEVVV